MLHTPHLSSLFENSTEGIILTEGKGPVVLINPAAERMFGYAATEIIGRPIECLIPERSHQKHIALRERFHHQPQTRVMGHGRDLYGRKRDGAEFPVEVSLSFYDKDGQLFVIAFVVDITRRKQIEDEFMRQQHELRRLAINLKELNVDLEKKVDERTMFLREALRNLEVAQKETQEALEKEKQLNEIKSRFMSIASHEFRTPLSTVLSSASLLSKYVTEEDQPRRSRHIEKIKNAVRSLNAILDDFLSLEKIEEGKITTNPDQFDIRDFMLNVVEEINMLLKPGQKISVSQSGSVTANTDKRLLKNILINLITNAIKFSNEGSTIQINIHSDEDEFKFDVVDAGIGIPKEELHHLFSSFYRARNAVNIKGTGLGLHIVKRYLDLLQGSIKVETELGKGSAFFVKIPQSPN